MQLGNRGRPRGLVQSVDVLGHHHHPSGHEPLEVGDRPVGGIRHGDRTLGP